MRRRPPLGHGAASSPKRQGAALRQSVVIQLFVWACLAAMPALADTPNLTQILDRVEQRYNHARTLEVNFEESYLQGRTQKTEAGVLYLRKPGRMRWEYSSPPGKLFVSDGKYVYLYTPTSNRVERMKAKASEDMRAPLAFLLGKLNFQRDFGRFESRPEGQNLWIRAEAKSNNLPYTNVEFVVTPDSRIRRVQVTGQDGSVLDFRFADEKVNPPLNDAMFRFQVPPGAEVVEASE